MGPRGPIPVTHASMTARPRSGLSGPRSSDQRASAWQVTRFSHRGRRRHQPLDRPSVAAAVQIHNDGSDTAGAARQQHPSDSASATPERFSQFEHDASSQHDPPVHEGSSTRQQRRRSSAPSQPAKTRVPQPHSHPRWRSRRGTLFFTAAATQASSSEWDALIETALPTSKLIPNPPASTTADHNLPSNFTSHQDRWRRGAPASATRTRARPQQQDTSALRIHPSASAACARTLQATNPNAAPARPWADQVTRDGSSHHNPCTSSAGGSAASRSPSLARITTWHSAARPERKRGTRQLQCRVMQARRRHGNRWEESGLEHWPCRWSRVHHARWPLVSGEVLEQRQRRSRRAWCS